MVAQVEELLRWFSEMHAAGVTVRGGRLRPQKQKPVSAGAKKTDNWSKAAGPAKGAKVFDALRESADASSDLLAVESAEWLVDELDIIGSVYRPPN